MLQTASEFLKFAATATCNILWHSHNRNPLPTPQIRPNDTRTDDR